MTRTTKLWLGVGPVGVALTALVIWLNVTSDHQTAAAVFAALGSLVGVAFLFTGLLAATRHPENGTGFLLIAVTFAWYLAGLSGANNATLYTFGSALTAVYFAVVIHLLVAFPKGSLENRSQRLLIAALYGISVLVGLLPTLFEEHPGCSAKDGCPDSSFLITKSDTAANVINGVFTVVGVAIFLGIVYFVLLRRWRAATVAARRTLTPVYLSGGVTLLMIGLAIGLDPLSGLASGIFWFVGFAGFVSLPFLFLAGLLRPALARSAAARLLLQTPEEPTPEEAETSLRLALGDPSLQLLTWLEERGSYVDTEGRLVSPAQEQSGRAATMIEYEGRPLAAIVHDVALLGEPERLEDVVAVARLALEKDRGRQALRQAEARQRALLNAMPDLMIRTARDGTYLDVQGNPSALARPAAELIGRTIWDVIPAEVATPLMECVYRTLDTGLPQTIEYQLELDGDRRDFEARMVKSGEDEVLAIVREFTERRRLQDELRARLAEIEREQEFTRTVVNMSPIVFLLVDPEGRILRYNDTCETLTGYKDDERVRGRPFWDVFVAPEHREQARHVLAQLAAGAPRVQEKAHWLTKNGDRLVISTSSTAILDGQGRFRFLICGLDMTERERHLEELRASRARLVEAGDAERRRLERNLHDGAQQRLVSLSLALRLAQAKLGSDPGDADLLLRGASEELGLALEELRELARGIHPAILTDRGLAAALEAVAQRAPVPVDLEAVPADRLPGPVEAAAFYVVSESLTNVAKYAQASAARVRIDADNGYAVVEVADDGVGGADPALGSGLRGLADRVEALDGRLEVESPPGGGTQVRAVIPILPIGA